MATFDKHVNFDATDNLPGQQLSRLLGGPVSQDRVARESVARSLPHRQPIPAPPPQPRAYPGRDRSELQSGAAWLNAHPITPMRQRRRSVPPNVRPGGSPRAPAQPRYPSIAREFPLPRLARSYQGLPPLAKSEPLKVGLPQDQPERPSERRDQHLPEVSAGRPPTAHHGSCPALQRHPAVFQHWHARQTAGAVQAK